MVLLAVIIPVLMLVVLLALGQYEDLLLPRDEEPPTTASGPAGTPASSP